MLKFRERRTASAVLALVAALALVGAACGDDDGGDDEAVEAPEGREDQDPEFDELREGGVDDEDATDDDEATDGDESDGEDADEYEDYTTVESDDGSLSYDVPEEWDDVLEAEPDFGTELAASPDADAFTSFDAPGLNVYAAALDDLPEEEQEITNEENTEAKADDYADFCDDRSGVEEYDDGFYEGAFEVLTDCDGGYSVVVLSATDPDGEYFVDIVGLAETDADVTAIENALVTSVFEV